MMIVLLATGCLFYCIGVGVIVIGICRAHTEKNAGPVSVTIILAAHNEEKSISGCLDSLLAQDYPHELMTIIAVNDRSTDGTAEILDQYQQRSSRINVVTIERVPDGISPKKNALARALELVQTDVVLQTDADCEPPEGWVKGMVAAFGDNVGMVAGVAPYSDGKGWLNSFVRHEYLWNAALASGMIGLKRGSHASGRNMGFRLSAFKAAGGYGEGIKVLSGDDTLLLQSISRRTEYEIVSVRAPETHVYTESPAGFPQLIRQRIRHMSTGRYFDIIHMVTGVAVYTFHALMLVAIPLSLILHNLLPSLFAVFLLKLIVDSIACIVVNRNIFLSVEWRRFVINEIFLVPYMAVMPLLGTIIPVKWKEKG